MMYQKITEVEFQNVSMI